MKEISIKDSPELSEALNKALDWFEGLTPEQKRQHLAEQRKSWVIGEMMLEHPNMTRAEAEAIYNKATGEK